MMKKDTILVTSPLLPSLDEFDVLLHEIWDSKWVTNNGTFHQRLEAALCEYLKVPFISLLTIGILATAAIYLTVARLTRMPELREALDIIHRR